MEDNNKLEIADMEHYKDQDQIFSHQALVMRSLNKCIELGAKELIEGFYDEQTQGRDGNVKVIYKEDTRRAFIEAVKTAKMIMICDFDDEAIEKINKLTKSTKDSYAKYVQEQKVWYNNAPIDFQEKHPVDLRYLSPQPIFQQFWNSYIEEVLDIYRSIFEELSQLTKRQNFYGVESFGG